MTAEQIKAPQPTVSFEYELFEGDPDHLRTVVATPTQTTPWIKPSDLKLKHRIGRGTFGDVWLATHHQSADDFDEYHEVAVKMLHPLKEDLTQVFVDTFEGLFLKCREIPGVCWLHGISIIEGKICVAMKFYEGSIADRMAWLKGGKLQLADVLRYGTHLAKGIQELHSIGLLLLNLKPSNFLLNEHDQLVLGDFGIPYLLLGIPLLNSDMTLRLGTPNYMAPEQWEPESRGPMSTETDSWCFGCSIVEMLSGCQPWFGKSIKEIYQSVVIKQEKPRIPSGLPPDLESVLIGCFEYDLRQRPSMEDILIAFLSSQKLLQSDGGWIEMEDRVVTEKSIGNGYSVWFLRKDRLQLGDTVRSRKPWNARKVQTMDIPKGTIVGLDSDTEINSFILVKTPGANNPLRVHDHALERVTNGFVIGEWVRLKDEKSGHSSVGILHTVQRDGGVAVGFTGLATLWMGNSSLLQMADAYYIGQFVRLKSDVVAPRFDWPHKGGGDWAVGRISEILPNGCLVVRFPGRLVFEDVPKSYLADPAEAEIVSFDNCPGVVEKYQHMEDFHWAVRPLSVALGIFTATKLTIFIGRTLSKRTREGKKPEDAQASGNAGWLPPPVANILFKDGVSTTTVR